MEMAAIESTWQHHHYPRGMRDFYYLLKDVVLPLNHKQPRLAVRARIRVQLSSLPVRISPHARLALQRNSP